MGMLHTSLASAFRMSVACTIVATATIYGPAPLRRVIAFPAFAYFTVMVIATDAALGDAVRGCFLALFATVQSLCPAAIVFWVVGPARFSYGTVSVAVAVAAAVVALPGSTHLVAKRLALGQIVVVYVVGFNLGVHAERLMHPVHVAASVAMGAIASLLATLLPFPRLASFEVKEKSKAAAEMAAARLSLFVEALVATDSVAAAGSISKASSMSSSAAKLFPIIKRYQESMQWEKLPFKFRRISRRRSAGDRLQSLELPLRGMELALLTIPSHPVHILQNQLLKDGIFSLQKNIVISIKQTNGCSSFDSSNFLESNPDDFTTVLRSIQIPSDNHQNLPPLFFIFCMQLLQIRCETKEQEEPEREHKNFEGCSKKRSWLSSLSLMAALKCSLSLWLAVLLGLIYSRESGFWAGLAIAIGLGSGREATFKVANVKAQGTALGSVYGVLCFCVFERYLPVRILCLLPWLVFTSFLRCSRMYGPAGGISAVVGAVLILGRKDYGPPTEFAIARIVETFIGLSSSTVVDILLQPTRASKMAKIQLTASFRTLKTCLNSLSFRNEDLEANYKSLKTQVEDLKKFMEEAEIEPNFWFLPLHISCYSKLFNSLSKMADFFTFISHAMKNIEQNLPIMEDSWKKITEKLENDLEKFKKTMDSSLSFYADVTALKSLRVVEKKGENDIEMGKAEKAERKLMGFDEMVEMEKMVGLFLQHCGEVMEDIGEEGDGSEEAKSEAVINLTAIAFCLKGLMKETKEIEEAIRELIQWENPSSHVDFKEIACKLHAVQN